MKDFANGLPIIKTFSNTAPLILCLKHFLSAAFGFFMARASGFGAVYPLGAAFVGGLPLQFMPSSAFGALIGYIIPFNNDKSGFQYIAALFAIVAIRILIRGIKSVSESPLWAAAISGTAILGVGIASIPVAHPSDVILCFFEGVIAASGAFFFKQAFAFKYKELSGLSAEQSACLFVALNLALSSLFSITIASVSLGRMLSVALIIIAAKYGKAAAAGICSATAALCILLSSGDAKTAVLFAFFGIAAGITSSIKLISLITCPIIAAVAVIALKGSSASVAVLIETVIASAITLFIPKDLTAKIGTVVSPPTTTPDLDGLRKALTMRLSFASSALHGVSEIVEDVAKCLSVNKKPEFPSVLRNIENDACRGCSLMLYCWEKNRETTLGAVLAMSDALRKCQPLTLAETPDEFSSKCLRFERFENSVSRHYTEYLNTLSAEKRVAEMREVLSDQTNGVADMLSELAEEFSKTNNYDTALATRIAASLRNIGLKAAECSCCKDKYDRMTVEIRLRDKPEVPINRSRILNILEDICDLSFEAPEINSTGKGLFITVTEKAVFNADCYFAQINQGKNTVCGDTCKYFLDGRGRLVVIISDGMGSGCRAAVDSAMTASLAERLIRAGFGYDCTLRLVNSSMLYKSSDESLATLDISCIDLYTGKTELLKAGSAPTLVRRNGRTGKAECHSLPAGILHEIGFDRAFVTLSEDDILLMMSDGAVTDGTDWISAEIEHYNGGSAKQLATHIAESARRRRKDGHDDDITVFAAILGKAI